LDLTFGPDEEQIADAAAQFLRQRLPVSRAHLEHERQLPAPLQEIAELGWFAITLPEELGGLGMSVVEDAIVYREIGRFLAPTDILGTSLAAEIAARGGERELAGALMAGTAGAGIAIPLPGGAEGEHLLFNAGAEFAATAGPERAALWQVPTDGKPFSCLDKTIACQIVNLDPASAVAVSDGPTIFRRALLATAAMQTGLAEAVLAMIVEYARIRETFGRPIGAYQAVRHPCADMAVRAEAARAQLFYAAIALRDGMDEAGALIDGASLVARRAAIANVDRNIQLHGGIGISEEHDAHLFMKRAQVLGQFLSSERATLDRLAAAGRA